MLSAERNGIRLCFEERQGADAPVVLVHGWCCDHTYLAPQFEHFAKQGRGVVALDLSGHGLSDKPREPYTMQRFADDVAFVCGHLGVKKVVVIGHSMGGVVAFDLASRHPELVSALIMLDAAIVLPPAARAAIPGLLADLGGSGYQSAIRGRRSAQAISASRGRRSGQRMIDRFLAIMLQRPRAVVRKLARDFDEQKDVQDKPYDPESRAERKHSPRQPEDQRRRHPGARKTRPNGTIATNSMPSPIGSAFTAIKRKV